MGVIKEPEPEPALRNHLIMQGEFVAYKSITDERSCESEIRSERSTAVKARFKDSCSGKMLQF